MTPRATPISPAFHSFLASAEPDATRDAIIVYAGTAEPVPQVRGRLLTLKHRLDDIKQRAASQQSMAEGLLSSFSPGGAAQRPRGKQLEAERAGENLPVLYAEVTRKTLPKLASQPNVVAILPNQRVRLIGPREVRRETLEKGETKDKVTWGLKRLGIPEMWKESRGAGINVAVLDTGVYGDHEALVGKVKDFILFDPVGRRIATRGTTFDAAQHGTHVCGTIAGGQTKDGVAIGVAPEAKLLVAGVLLGDATLLSLVKAIDWAIEKGAHVISMSLGFEYYEPLFPEVFRRVLDYGVLPVVAIGNEYHGNTSSPGSAHNALSVGAAERVAGGRTRVEVAGFSSGASLSFPGEAVPLVTKPDVVAPGVQVYSCIPPERTDDGKHLYAYMDGSSMATPHVAGAAALIMAARPEAPVTTIMQALRETAEHPSGVNRPDNRWGYGLIRPAAALAKL